ncbi:MAG: hypothetical protein MI923_19600 [Phycisphaerales bacterium]|nr:hypothetical protein [Phycisphaerales bacterium]
MRAFLLFLRYSKVGEFPSTSQESCVPSGGPLLFETLTSGSSNCPPDVIKNFRWPASTISRVTGLAIGPLLMGLSLVLNELCGVSLAVRPRLRPYAE